MSEEPFADWHEACSSGLRRYEMSSWLPANESALDRGMRVILGLALLSLLVLGPVPGWGLIGLVGLVPLVTGAVGSCPLYRLIGVSTRRIQP